VRGRVGASAHPLDLEVVHPAVGGIAGCTAGVRFASRRPAASEEEAWMASARCHKLSTAMLDVNCGPRQRSGGYHPAVCRQCVRRRAWPRAFCGFGMPPSSAPEMVRLEGRLVQVKGELHRLVHGPGRPWNAHMGLQQGAHDEKSGVEDPHIYNKLPRYVSTSCGHRQFVGRQGKFTNIDRLAHTLSARLNTHKHYRSNRLETAAAEKDSPACCSAGSRAALAGPRSIVSDSGVTAGGFQSASAASDPWPHAAT
jgi:hypothetical protein